MADARRAELYATLARSTAAAAAATVAQGRALEEQARAYAELAQLEAGEAGVRVDVSAAGVADPANDAQVAPASPVKQKRPRARVARPVPGPVGNVPVDEVTAARAARILRRWKAT